VRVLSQLLNRISTLTAFSCCAAMLFFAFLLQRDLVTRLKSRKREGENGKMEAGLMASDGEY
jgi:hypothetical protein